MPGNYTLRRTYVDGDILSASDYVADHQQHIDNQTPQGTDDYSAGVVQMRLTTDTGDTNGESLATSLAGELERLRYQIKHIKETINGAAILQWYAKSYSIVVANGTITTTKLANGATYSQDIRTVSSNVAVNDTAEHTLVSQAITLSRTRVRIRFMLNAVDFHTIAGSDTYTIKIKRGTTVIATTAHVTSATIGQQNLVLTEEVTDTTSVGTKTYSATVQITTGNTLTLVNNSRLILQEVV